MKEPIEDGMQRIYWTISMSLVGCKKDGWFDIEIDASDEQIEESAREEAWQNIDWNWSKDDQS